MGPCTHDEFLEHDNKKSKGIDEALAHYGVLGTRIAKIVGAA